jgi:hypothetical protein
MAGAICIGVFVLIPLALAILLIRWAWKDTSESPVLRILAYAGAACLLFGLVVLPAILFPVFKQAREAAIRTSCISNLHEIGRALSLYAADNGAYPGPQWSDTIGSKLDSEFFTCEGLDNPYGYTLNEAAVGLDPDSIADLASFVLAFDGAGGKNRVAGVEDVKWRHIKDKAAFLFGDGNVSAANQAESAGLAWQPN